MVESESSLAFVCGYTEDDSGGVFACHQDETSGTLQESTRTPVKASSFLAFHPNKEFLYTVNQDRGGVVNAFRIEDARGTLTDINRVSSEGEGPCYVSVDATGSYAFVSNYAGGTVAMVPIAEDGQVGEAVDVVHHDGSSVDPERQQEPHPHSIGPGPENRFVYVPDLGTDRVMIYEIDFEADELTPADPAYVELHDGAGPRHFAFHPNEQFAYVINELDSTVTTFEWDPETGGLDEVQTVTALPDGYDEESYTADIHVHPTGNWVYGSNRGHDSIVVFEVDQETGRLDAIQHESTRGHWPRDCALDPNGEFLYAENRRSDSIVAFEIDETTGKLTPIDQQIDVPEPVCLKFLQQE